MDSLLQTICRALNSGQKFRIETEEGNVLSYPAYLGGIAVHHNDNDRHSLSFFDKLEGTRSSTFFIADHHDILSISV